MCGSSSHRPCTGHSRRTWQNLLDIVVKTVCRGEGQHLTDLTAQPHTLIAESVDEMLCERKEPFVGEFLMQDRFHDLMGNVVEEFREIKQQDIALIAVFPVVLMEMLRDRRMAKS